MKALFDEVSLDISQIITKKYSTSFSRGIGLLSPAIRPQIYAIYGFVRIADEIVDSFLAYPQEELMSRFEQDYFNSLEDKISLNPVLNAFQKVVLQYDLQEEVDTFLASMKMDLSKNVYQSKEEYDKYILGSAEVVGLMCLKVFVNGNQSEYERLKPFAMKLGSAFQKVNFLRDFQADYEVLGRIYFPEVSFGTFDEEDKKRIIKEIELEFAEALEGIKTLPQSSRLGVYTAYKYYLVLLQKIKAKEAKELLQSRIRVPDYLKGILLFKSLIRNRLNVL